jgi:hypothetical protein
MGSSRVFFIGVDIVIVVDSKRKSKDEKRGDYEKK